MKYYRMQQILLDPHPYAPAVLDRIFADLSGVGCNSILLEYHATFPYQGILSSAVRSNAYTREEILFVLLLHMELRSFPKDFLLLTPNSW